MTILEWPSSERPREKLMAQGANALSDAELLAILFGTGTKGKTAIDLARDLLQKYQGLRGLFAASMESFCQLPGMGVSKYTQCQAAMELSRRHLQESLQRDDVITKVEDVEQFLIASLRGFDHEVFACLFLDNRHRIIRFEKLFNGSIDTTSVHPRLLIKRALHHNAAAVILAHNHPSGVAEPSQADRQITQLLAKTLRLVDVRLLDHMIVGDTTITSFVQRGLLP